SRSLLGLEKLALRGLHYVKKMETPALAKEIDVRVGGDTVRIHLEDGTIGDEANLLKNLSAAQKTALADGAKARASTFMEMIEIGQFIKKPAVYADDKAKVHGAPKMRELMSRLLGTLRAIP